MPRGTQAKASPGLAVLGRTTRRFLSAIKTMVGLSHISVAIVKQKNRTDGTNRTDRRAGPRKR